MNENPLNPLTVEERIKYVERASVSFFFFVISFLTISNPSSIPSLYGYGAIVFMILFMISFPLCRMVHRSNWSFSNSGCNSQIDYSHQ
jgi:hypothetical protein